MSQKETREEVEHQETLLESIQHDVSEEAAPVLDFITKNAKTITAALAAVVVMVGGYGAYEYNAKQQLNAARSELGNIVVNIKPAERSVALADFAKEAPAELKNTVLIEQLRNSVATREYAAAVKEWEALASGNNKDLAVVAAMGKVNALFADGKKAEAFESCKALAASSSDAYKVVVNRLLAAVAEEAEKYEAAVAAYETLKESASGQEQAYYGYKIASLRARLNS